MPELIIDPDDADAASASALDSNDHSQLSLIRADGGIYAIPNLIQENVISGQLVPDLPRIRYAPLLLLPYSATLAFNLDPEHTADILMAYPMPAEPTTRLIATISSITD